MTDTELEDHAAIGKALLDQLKRHMPNWHWDTCPSEIVLYLLNFPWDKPEPPSGATGKEGQNE